MGAKVDELFHLDIAYAPPISTTKDPVHYTWMMLDNALINNRSIIVMMYPPLDKVVDYVVRFDREDLTQAQQLNLMVCKIKFNDKWNNN